MVNVTAAKSIADKVIATSVNSFENYGFSRLKRFFIKSQNYNNYKEIVSTAKNKVVGNIPKELIDLILKTNPENKSFAIKEAQNAFAQCAEKLKYCQIAKLDAVKNIKGEEAEKNFIFQMLCHNHATLPPSKDEIEMIEFASFELEKCLKNLLPNGAKVKINYVNDGVFKNCYRLEIFDSKGKKITHDRALSIYKDIGLSGDVAQAEIEKIKELYPKYSNQEILDYAKSQGKIFPTEKEQKALIELENIRKNLKTKSYDSMSSEQTSFMKDHSSSHGLCAEANTVTRLNHILGHSVEKTNAVKTDMFNLNTGFQIAQFSDGSLPKVTSPISWIKYGLHASDLHKSNTINGRIVDFGKIEINEKLLSDNTTLSWYKKIMNRENLQERNMVLERTKELAANPKTPLRTKILDAIKIAEQDIQIENSIHNFLKAFSI